jgi:hypothetical protein
LDQAGVLNAAAVGRGHLSAHDALARLAGPGTGSVYRLLEGSPSWRQARVAVWIEKPRGVEMPLLAALLGDGMDGAHSGLWQRQLALGPAPEYCLLAGEAPSGVRTGAAPRGWSATVAAARAAVSAVPRPPGGKRAPGDDTSAGGPSTLFSQPS